MTVADKEMYFNYDASGVPVSIVYNGTSYYYVTNLQGDVVGIVNQSGNQLVAYTYDAWGNVLTTTGSSAGSLGKYNPLRYRGYVYDTETKLYYLQSRYYNPEWGRFINADAFAATGQGLLGNNMFVYCLNNPVVNIDSSGLFSQNLVFAVRTDSYSYKKNINNQALSTISNARRPLLGNEDGYVENEDLLYEIITICSFEDAVTVYNKIMSYELAQDVYGINKIRSGWSDVKNGAAFFVLPAPTWADEVVGGSKMIWGVGKIVQGIVELIDGGK